MAEKPDRHDRMKPLHPERETATQQQRPDTPQHIAADTGLPAAHPSSSAHVVWQAAVLERAQRVERNGHKAAVVWLTGLPGSGKSTVAHAAEARLHASGFQTVVLDGDNLRHGLCADLGFSDADRRENMRRVGEVAKLFLMQGTVALVALVSPMRGAREAVRALLPEGDFIEVYCNSPLAVCQARDPKGMYARARQGLIAEFTGVSAPYEAPLEPALVLATGLESVESSVDQLVSFLCARLTKPDAATGKSLNCAWEIYLEER